MIKTLGAYVKEFKRASIATPCYMILEVLMEMMIPYLMASIIDDGVNKGDMKHICVVGAGMLVIAAIVVGTLRRQKDLLLPRQICGYRQNQ